MPCRAPADVSPAHMFGVQNTPIRNSPAAAAMSILSPSPPYPVKCCLQRHPDESSEYMDRSRDFSMMSLDKNHAAPKNTLTSTFLS